MNKLSLTLLCLLAFFSSCNNDEKKLHEKLNAITNQEITGNKQLSKGVSLDLYKEIELKMNKAYVASLKNLIDNSFEMQLETFQDNEQGVISGYKYMFKYIVSNEQEWNDMQTQLSDRYFNSLIIQQKANELSNEHIKDITNLRSQFYSGKSGMKAPQLSLLRIPKSEIFLGGLDEHSGRNLALEIGTTILDILLGLLLTWIVVNIIGYVVTGPIGCLISIISFIIVMVISVLFTNYNDDKLIQSLRDQNKSISIDYDEIHKKLDKNTISFYDKIK